MFSASHRDTKIIVPTISPEAQTAECPQTCDPGKAAGAGRVTAGPAGRARPASGAQCPR